jgi:hypothetical protein
MAAEARAGMKNVRSSLMGKGNLGLNQFYSAIPQKIFLLLSDMLVVV